MLLYKVKPLLQYFAVFFVEQRPSLGSVQTHLRLKIWRKIKCKSEDKILENQSYNKQLLGEQ